MSHHFISYSKDSEANKDFTIKLCDKLQEGPPSIPVWLDVRNLQPGIDYDEQLVEAIRTCDSLLFLMTNDSAEDRSFCKFEWSRALKYKKPIVPLLLEHDADIPFRLANRQYIDFTGAFEPALSKLRNHLQWLASPAGVLQGMKDRLIDAERDLRRAQDPLQQARIRDEIEQLKKDIAKQQHIIDDPVGEARRVEESIARGLERERQPEKPISSATHTRFINPPPGVAPNYFQDRHVETKLIGDFLKNDAQRLMIIAGRAGMGKTAMVCRLLKSLEGGKLPDDGGSLSVEGIVYLSETGSRRVNVPNLYADLCRLLPDDIAKNLEEYYKNPKISTEAKMQALLTAFPQGRVILLLDNFENLIDPVTRNISKSNSELDEAMRAILNLPQHAVKVILTTRIAPYDLSFVQPGRQMRHDLDEGLKSPYAENILREMDVDGKVGLKNAPNELLDEARKRTLGNPRALEALFAILSADRDTTLPEILGNAKNLLPERVVEVLVGEAFSRLDPAAQRVIQALAIYARPVTPSAVDYLLQPYVPGIDSASVLKRLVNGQFVRKEKETSHYYTHPVDRSYALSRIPGGDASDREKTDAPPFSQFALLHRGAEYFRQVRKPRENWKNIDDLSPQLAEFDLRCAGQDYDTAANVLLEIDFDCLLLWGYYRLVIEIHQRLEGKLSEQFIRQNCTSNLGTAYWSMGQYLKAITYYEQAHDIAREMKERGGEGTWLGSLGLAYYKFGQVDKAIEYFEKALDIAREIGDRYCEALVNINIGDSFTDRSECDKAKKYYSQAITVADEIKNAQCQSEARSGLALSHLFSSDLPAARSAAESASQYDYPSNNHRILALLGVIALRQSDDARGLALCGLALCTGDKRYITDAVNAYMRARAITGHAGIVGRVLRLFDEMAKADIEGLLAGVREAAGGGM